MPKRLQLFSDKEFREIYSKVPHLTVEIILKLGRGVVLSRVLAADFHE
jgi:hypothetical protein